MLSELRNRVTCDGVIVLRVEVDRFLIECLRYTVVVRRHREDSLRLRGIDRSRLIVWIFDFCVDWKGDFAFEGRCSRRSFSTIEI